ncbi:MAG: hypothetical protein A2Z16_00485 [Chloroflexi bacterium RBG_16_54_18]|nr:MAG: hypothetical protein A2Z16_00485 [Chloroflexi bacterium RBG_16_54_18]
MNDQEKKAYQQKYDEAKRKGSPFFPDVLFKDAVVSLVVFLILVGLAYFIGAPLEERANPADTSYTPRPEWYFLFLFQLLKYFPGNLEIIGVFILPTTVILLLLVLPLLDRSPYRHPVKRLGVLGMVTLVTVGIVVLTVLSIQETPPPIEASIGDPVAELYSRNCAGCHGQSITATDGKNLREIITQGSHEGMPAWSGDLTSDQVDALAGFILSPDGSRLFEENCSNCHDYTELVSTNPAEIRKSLEMGANYEPHSTVELTDRNSVIDKVGQAALLNFLLAPDGQRLFEINCASCHGRSVKFSGDEVELTEIISKGGMHLDMPPWRDQLTESEIDTLANYVVEPSAVPNGGTLFRQYCASCHGSRIPQATDVAEAREVIASGGSHETMPVWGEILTTEQMDALVNYTLEAASGIPTQIGEELFVTNCSGCHGSLGEGGPNPTRQGDIIAPISSAEYLKTRDDTTLQSIIAQGQPNFGMSPFGSAYGGPLEDDEINALVAYMRSWEQNPPVELPPEVSINTLSLESPAIYLDLCAQCHGEKGEGKIAPSLISNEFQEKNADQDIFDTINQGHEATTMIGWGEILGAEQIQGLVEYIRELGKNASPTPVGTLASSPTFEKDILPIFQENCNMCHGDLGGWDGSTYESAMTSGDHAPVIVPGDEASSLLAQKILGTHSEGSIMPPSGRLPDEIIQIILDWIAMGAPEN